MGAMYEAEDLRLGRHVALKLLLESQATNSKACAAAMYLRLNGLLPPTAKK